MRTKKFEQYSDQPKIGSTVMIGYKLNKQEDRVLCLLIGGLKHAQNKNNSNKTNKIEGNNDFLYMIKQNKEQSNQGK